MTWREQYQQGSFRGVPFLTESEDRQGGRRNARHIFPKRDTPYVEDMGRQPRAYNITALVLGDDYMAQRDRLIEALEQGGAGTLVHPYYGSLTVAVDNYRISQSTANGGMASLQLSFVESGENVFPAATVATADVVNARADDALSTIKDVFVSRFNVDGLPAAVAEHASGLVADLNTSMSSITARFPTVPDSLGDYVGDLIVLSGNVSSLIRSPGNLVDSVVGIISKVGSVFQRPRDAVKVYQGWFNYSSNQAAAPSGGVVFTAQGNNQTAFMNLVEHTALIEAARTSSTIEFDNYSDAVAMRDLLDEELDAVMLTADDESYRALSHLRVASIQDITARGADLARISRYTPKTTEPALVIAHRLYQDATRSDEIAVRNAVPHPGFVAGDSELEVLTT